MIHLPLTNPSQPNLQVNGTNYYAKNLYIINARHAFNPNDPKIQTMFEIVIEHEPCTNGSDVVYMCFLLSFTDVDLRPTFPKAGKGQPTIAFADIVLDSIKYAEADKQNKQRKLDNTEIIDENQNVVYVHPEDIDAKLPTQALFYKDGNSATVIVFSEPIVVKSIANLDFTTASNAIKSGGYFFKDNEVKPSFIQIKNLSLSGTKCLPGSKKKEGFVEGLTPAEIDSAGGVTMDKLKNAGMICVPSTDTDQTDLTTMLQTDTNAPLARDIKNAGNWHTVLSWITPVVIFGFALILLPFIYFQAFIPYILKNSDNTSNTPDTRYNKVVVYHFAILIPIIILSILCIGIGSVENMNLLSNGIALTVVGFVIGFVLFILLPLYDKFKNKLGIKDSTPKLNYSDIFSGTILKINKLFWPLLLVVWANINFKWIQGYTQTLLLKSIYSWLLLLILFTVIFIPIYQRIYSGQSSSPHTVRLISYIVYFCVLAFISSIMWILDIKINNTELDYEKN